MNIKNKKIEEVLKKLNCLESEEIQEEGRKEASELENLSVLIQPYNNYTWENCALVLYNKSDEELEPYLEGLLEWMLDLNCSGAMTILQRLIKFDSIKIKQKYEQMVYKIYKENDENMINQLLFLSLVLENSDIKKVIDPKCLKILEKNKEESDKIN